MWTNKAGTYIIAEIGVNHNGDIDIAKKLIDASKECGADAVKFQTFRAENLVTKDAEKAEYQKANDDRHDNQFDMLKALELSDIEYKDLLEYCEKMEIDFLSTPFDEGCADLLENIGVNGFKVSSGDLTNLPLLAHMAKKGLPMIISTGMVDISAIEHAVTTIEANGNPELAILHCVSNYPAPIEDANLRAMQTIQTAFGKTVGWSDHTLGEITAILSIACGAKIIEKHITLDKNMEGPDHIASSNIPEFKSYVNSVRLAEKALGNGIKRPRPSELNTAKIAQKSLTASRFIKAGEVLDETNLTTLRPAHGISPLFYKEVYGKIASKDISTQEQLKWDMVS